MPVGFYVDATVVATVQVSVQVALPVGYTQEDLEAAARKAVAKMSGIDDVFDIEDVTVQSSESVDNTDVE